MTEAARRAARSSQSIEGRPSWVAASLTLAILSVSYGAPLIVVVGLKPIAASLGADRSVVALAASLVWLGTGLGGIFMGWVADRIGMRPIAIFGALMTALGLAVSAIGADLDPNSRQRRLDRPIGQQRAFSASGDLCQPLVRPPARNGSRVDLVRAIFSRLCLAGHFRARHGGVRLAGNNAGVWCFDRGGHCAARLVLAPATPPRLGGEVAIGCALSSTGAPAESQSGSGIAVLGSVFVLRPDGNAGGASRRLCAAISGSRRRAAQQCYRCCSAAPFSVACSGDGRRTGVGGLAAVFAGSACQALAIAAFAVTQDEAGLFAVSAVYGLGFSGIIPAYVVAIRDLFPSTEASWRVPLLLFTGMSGMAFGGWFAGALYDNFGFYAPAFAAGAIFNLANLAVIGSLVARQLKQSRTAAIVPAQ